MDKVATLKLNASPGLAFFVSGKFFELQKLPGALLGSGERSNI